MRKEKIPITGKKKSISIKDLERLGEALEEKQTILPKREMKFRAWNEALGKMEDNVFPISATEYYCIDTKYNSILKRRTGKVLQYTGLKDKNGKEIYEGDIIEFNTDGVVFRFPVEWGEYDDGEYIGGLECWMVGKTPLSSLIKDEVAIYAPAFFADDGVKVIGNVFENPELLDNNNG